MQTKSRLKNWLLFSTAATFTGIGAVSALNYAAPELLSDHPFLRGLASKLDVFQAQTKAEKVYLQFDKPFYKPNETIWFSAYVRDAKTLQKAESRIVYVELLNPKGAVEKTISLIATDGQAAGEFQLPESAKGGIYKIRAYTQWQKNTQELFEREITVQAVVLPNLNMKLDFERESYGAGEEFGAELLLANLDNTVLANHEFQYVLSVDGAQVATEKGKTDANGKAIIRYKLPKNLNSNDALLNVMLSHKGLNESISRSVPIVLGDIDLQFFPEGGDLVAGQKGRIAFKALNEFGKPADVQGVINDSKGNMVATFGTYHQGMGALDFTPQAGETYVAQIQSPVQLKTKYALPAAKTNAYSIRVDKQSKDKLNLTILAAQKEEIFIAVQGRNQMLYSEVLKVEAGENVLQIPTETFPVGIAQITVFDSRQAPRAERLVFCNPHQQLNVKISTNKEKFLPREKVEMTVAVSDEKGRPVQGNFSLSVADDKLLTFADDKQGHILSAVLLESDLQGKIEEPNFYFDNESDPKRFKPEINRARALDNLLLTQGWRRFEWKKVQDGQLPAMSLPAEKGLVSGVAVDADNKPVANTPIALVFSDPNQPQIIATTNAKGEFMIDNAEIYGNYQIKSVDNKWISANTANYVDFVQNLNLALYKKMTVKGLVKDKSGKVVKDAQVYNSLKGVYIPVNEKGEFEFETIDAPSYQYLYVYQPAYQYAPVNISMANLDKSKPIAITMEPYGVRHYHSVPNVAAGGGLELNAVAIDEVQEVRSARRNVEVKSAKKGAVPARAEVNKARFEDNDLPPAPPPVEDFVVVNKAQNVEPMAEPAKDAAADLPREDEKADKILDDAKKSLAKDRAEQKPVVVNVVSASRYYRARSFYAPKYEQKQENVVRNDLRSTIYFNPTVKTNAKGEAKIEFYSSDDISQFRVTLEGFGSNGEIGRSEFKYFSQKPFEMVGKLPTEVLSGDKLGIPLTFTNNETQTVKGQLQIALPSHLRWIKTPPATIELAAGKSSTVFLELEVLNQIAEGDFILVFKSKDAEDQLLATIKSRPRGFPVREVFAGEGLTNAHSFNVLQPIEGSLSATIAVYPSSLDEVMKGMESMCRMPSGCFEQTSSSNYPNVLALSYMRETNMSSPEFEKTIQGYLATGYSRLTGYESKSGGFHWWGYDPAHEALTAYGLMQFVDMQKVYPVDGAMIDRTAKWLMSRKDGKGGWQLNANCLHTWSKDDITHAYIVWALTEAGFGGQIKPELDKSYKDAANSKDAYLMALVANSLYNVKDATRADELTKKFAATQAADGSFTGLSTSVTHSTGKALQIEASGLAVLAMSKTKGYSKQINEAVKFIKASKDYYGYGSTQGTVLALKAILEHTKSNKKAAEDGQLLVTVNGKAAAKVEFKAGQKEILVPEISKYFAAGKNEVKVVYEKTKTALPFDVTLAYNTRVPISDEKCQVNLSTQLGSKTVKLGETSRLTANLRNTSNQSVSMAMAMIGIPAGLSVQPWQLKELQDKKVFDYYEIFEGYVVLHYERLKANELKTINFDLKADIAGTYEAPASTAFLYYNHQSRHWVNPEQVQIQ